MADILSIVVSVITYVAFPLIFAASKYKPIAKSKYIIISIVVNVALIFVLSTIAISLGVYIPFALPFLICTPLSIWLGIKILRKNSVLLKPVYVKDESEPRKK